MYKIIDKKVIYFLLLTALTILVSIFLAGNVASILYYFVLLIVYARSKDEGFWFAFFFITIDGFMGFLGAYSAVLNLLPGLPGIEVAQLYIPIAIYKIRKSKINEKPFYANWTILLFCYILVLVLIGLANGLLGDYNIYFRIAKLILPLVLFYTTPRLIKTIEQYSTVLKILFAVFIFAFASQLITVFTGYSPSAKWEVKPQNELEVGRNLRTYFNPFASIVVLCGALFFLTIKNQKFFPKIYLNIMVLLCFGMAFLSATRGWIIAFTFIIIAFNVFVNKLEVKNLILVLSLFVIVLAISLSFERINKQIMFSIERTLTLESLAKGDVTADGTLARLDERGPRVIEAWQESPVFGFGFSNAFFKKQDPHVGNLTLLLHAGIIGLVLVLLFFKFIVSSLLRLKSQHSNNPYKKGAMVIVIVLLGWFFIHSTSGQHFAFYGDTPAYIFPQAFVLALANFSITYKA